jgi:hypothetical protein
MLIEQVRYFVEPEKLEAVLEARRQESRIREALNLTPGVILVPDDPSPDEPLLVWQCGYEDEDQMAHTEQALIESEEYRAARDRLATLVTRVDLDLFVSDEG